MKQKLIGLLFVCACLSACSVRPVVPPPPPSDDASIKLTEAANSISESLLELARIQKMATPADPSKKLPDPASYDIIGIASIDWTGPVGPLLKHLAKSSHYHLRVLGKSPAIPVIVTVTAKDAPLADIIQDVDFQTGKKADIVVFPHSRVIELRYAKM